jgi:glycosyltransferase involved in cell wall biosynthesis
MSDRPPARPSPPAPSITVVIPNRERVDALCRAVDSIPVPAPDGAVEVLVVDDCSPNADAIEAALMARPARKGLTVRMLRLPARGNASVARNAGVAAATGTWIALLDSDDAFLPEKWEALRRALAACPEADVVHHAAQILVDGRASRVVPSRARDGHEPVGDFLFAQGELIPTPTIIARRQWLRQVPFRPGLRRHQDLQLLLDLEAAGARFHFVPVVGSAIHWSTAARPRSKGESPAFSHRWVQANAPCLSREARRGIVHTHVVRKALDAGDRRFALAVVHAEGTWRHPRRLLEVAVLVVAPRVLRSLLYRVYKRALQPVGARGHQRPAAMRLQASHGH